LIARDGIEAVQAFSEHYKSISVVLLDLTMPRMGGKEALNKMRSICTSTPIILTSGFNPEEVAGQFSDEHLTFLHKPYVGNDLIERVREALEA
jgi:CheY-like chemotaxis protein